SEAITNHFANGKIIAKSAGSQPVGEVHPLSIQYLQEAGISTESLASQSWDEFEDFDADIVVTVCDSAAGESCPVWFGNSVKVHWGLTDPSKLEGTEAQLADAFRATITEIKGRVEQLASIDVELKDKKALKLALENLGAS
ncbi:MAG: arsenate reductase ArsC, partial [Paraglaciecola sp.]